MGYCKVMFNLKNFNNIFHNVRQFVRMCSISQKSLENLYLKDVFRRNACELEIQL